MPAAIQHPMAAEMVRMHVEDQRAIQDVALRFGVHPDTVRRYVRESGRVSREALPPSLMVAGTGPRRETCASYYQCRDAFAFASGDPARCPRECMGFKESEPLRSTDFMSSGLAQGVDFENGRGKVIRREGRPPWRKHRKLAVVTDQ